jgi:hypothetical protein
MGGFQSVARGSAEHARGEGGFQAYPETVPFLFISKISQRRDWTYPQGAAVKQLNILLKLNS